jgi:hypothetical protein
VAEGVALLWWNASLSGERIYRAKRDRELAAPKRESAKGLPRRSAKARRRVYAFRNVCR